MTKTYSEIRQATYFRAAVELYKLVYEIWSDNLGPNALGRSPANDVWAASILRTTFDRAVELETKGHEECIASTRQENWLRSHRSTAELCFQVQEVTS